MSENSEALVEIKIVHDETTFEDYVTIEHTDYAGMKSLIKEALHFLYVKALKYVEEHQNV